MVNRIFINILLSIFIAGGINAQQVSVKATTDTSDYKIGDYIKYQLEITRSPDVKILMPSIKDSLKNLEFIDTLTTSIDKVDNKIIEKRGYLFSYYDSARVTIPSFRIKYVAGKDTGLALVDSLVVNVHSLKIDPEKDIRDVKAPVTIPLDWLMIFLIILVVLIVLALIYIAYRYRKKKKGAAEESVETVKIPPHEKALASLKELEAKKLWQRGFIKDYHSEITEIIRKYFEERFGFNALEQTTSEIIDELRKSNDGGKIIDTSERFFNNADMVKFAKFEPLPEVNEEMMKQAYEIVERTAYYPQKEVEAEENV
ncbi:hypothetical protein ACSSWA_06615 [Melioribacter sp. Ez-97]|uniref:hypothetical protein n=1 Tax=Melioribacter sp. Ez-97 TaxID=3423434 RepID=UPI003ED8C82F